MKAIYQVTVASAFVTCLLVVVLLIVYNNTNRKPRVYHDSARSGVLAHRQTSASTARTVSEWQTQPYIIGGVDVGGSLKFINDLKTQFPGIIHIRTAAELQEVTFFANDVIFLQHLLHDIQVSDVTAVAQTYGCRLFVNVHDWMYILRSGGREEMEHVHSAYLPDYSVRVPIAVSTLFSAADHILHPSRFTFEAFSKYFDADNFLVSPHIDERVDAFAPRVPPIKRSTINIGVLHVFSECKGAEIIQALMKKARKYRGFAVEFKIVGVNIPEHTEAGFYAFLAQHNIHGLTLLNKWGETYCYALTKFLNSGLPIIYNNFGAFKERVIQPAAAEGPYFKVFDTESEFQTSKRYLLAPFHAFLNYIISNAGLANDDDGSTAALVRRPIVVPSLYTFLLDDSVYVPDMWQAVHQKVLPYCIYFPQHHAIPENDTAFYPGMTDIQNLFEYVAAGNANGVDTPCLATLGLRAPREYDQSQQSLVDRQVEVAKHWGMRGFCVQYYWFSKNEAAPGRRMVMQACHDLFFAKPYENFNVFFNWMNGSEDWAAAVGNSYEPDKLQPNVDNLLRYFAHPNYLKIDDRPVLLMQDSGRLNAAEMTGLQQMLDAACRAAGFAGVHVSGNSAASPDFAAGTHFCHRPHSRLLNADDQTPEQNAGIQTLFFNTDTSARHFKPYAPEKVVAINGAPLQQRVLADAVVRLYKKSERSGLAKILLINSWNEWGKDMAVEPGATRGCFFLKLLKLSLSRVL